MKLPDIVFLHTHHDEMLRNFYEDRKAIVKKMDDFLINSSNQFNKKDQNVLIIIDDVKDILTKINKNVKIIFIADHTFLTRQQFDQVSLMVPDIEALFSLYKMPDLVLFDMDGLLVDTEYLCLEPFRRAHEYYHYPISDETLHQLIGTSGVVLEKILRDTYDDQYPFEEVIELANQLTLEEIKQNLPIKPGVFTLLDYYKQRNIPCIVASSSPRETIELYIELGGMEGYFQEIACLDDVNKSKPEPDIFLVGCKKKNCLPKNCLVYEDSKNGIIAANRAGIPVVCVPDLIYHDENIFKHTLAFARSLDKFT